MAKFGRMSCIAKQPVSLRHVRAVVSTYTVFIEDRETYSSRWVDIRVEETLRELALWGFARVVLTEVQSKWEVAPFPISLQQ